MAPQRKALLVATYGYQDAGLRGLTAPAHDAESLADVLRDPAVAGFDVTVLLNEPAHVVGEAIAGFYGACRRDDLTLLYFSGHGLKDDDGRLYLAMTNTRRDSLLFTGLSATSISEAMDQCASRRKVLILDCCYSGAFPAGRTAKADPAVHTLERFQGKGRAVLTASDATSYSFEGDEVSGAGSRSVFTRYLVEAISSGAADLDDDGDITLDELYSYVHDRVVADLPQQRPKKQEDVDGRIVLARNVHWALPQHLRFALDSPIAGQRLAAVEALADLHRRGNDVVRSAVQGELAVLVEDDSRSVASAATALRARLGEPSLSPAESPPTASTVPSPRPAEPPPAPLPAAPLPAAPLPAAPLPAAPAARPVPVPPTSSPTSSPPILLVGLVVASALPLTLSRTLAFEANASLSADEFVESTLPWTLGVVVPLVLAALLLALSGRLPWAWPVGGGFLLGAALVLTETSLYWFARFAEERDTIARGPGQSALVVGWALVAAAAVVLVTRTPLAGFSGLRSRPELLWAVPALSAVLVAMVTVWEAQTAWIWTEDNAGLVLLGAAAAALTLLRLRRDQTVAGLIALGVLSFWLLYYQVEDYVQENTGIDPGRRLTQIVCVLVVLAACGAASLGTLRARVPATSEEARR